MALTLLAAVVVAGGLLRLSLDRERVAVELPEPQVVEVVSNLSQYASSSLAAQRDGQAVRVAARHPR